MKMNDELGRVIYQIWHLPKKREYTHCFYNIRYLGKGCLLRHMLLHRNQCRFVDLWLLDVGCHRQERMTSN